MTFNEFYQQGQALMAQQRYQEAADVFIKAFREAKQVNELTQVQHQLAQANYHAARYDRALNWNRNSLRYAPNVAEHWQLRAAICQQINQPEQAQIATVEATQPTQSDADWLRRSRALYRAQIYVQALEAVMLANQLNPANSEAWRHRVILEGEMYNPAAMVRAVKTAGELDHQQHTDEMTGRLVQPAAFDYFNQAKAQTDAERKLALLNDALASDPEFVAALAQKASLLNDGNRPEDALAALAVIDRVAPEIFSISGMRGDTLVKLGRYDEAIKEYDRELQKFPVGKLGSHYWSKKLQVYQVMNNDTLAKIAAGRADAALNRSRVYTDMPLGYPHNTLGDALFRVERQLGLLKVQLPDGTSKSFINNEGSSDIARGIFAGATVEFNAIVPTLIIRVQVRPGIAPPIPDTIPVTISLMYVPQNIAEPQSLGKLLDGTVTSFLNQVMNSASAKTTQQPPPTSPRPPEQPGFLGRLFGKK